MIEDLVFEDDRRGVFEYRRLKHIDPFAQAANALLESESPILILTGFYIPEAGVSETDGPLGACVLGKALEKCGKKVIYITDLHGRPLLEAIVNQDLIHEFPFLNEKGSRALTREWLDRLRPGVVIAVERPGKTRSGQYLTARGIDITGHTAVLDHFLDVPVSVAIGDGGNELGLGALAEFLPDNCPAAVCCADHILLGSTSNWAAYGLAAALEITSGFQGLLPDISDVTALINGVVAAGAVDGMTGKSTLSVDGYLLHETANVLARLARLIRMKTPVVNAFKHWREEQENRYGSAPHDIRISWDPNKSSIAVRGSLILSSQKDSLISALSAVTRDIETDLEILGDPESMSRQITWVLANDYPVDLMTKPAGKLTTQIAETDSICRKLWELPPWSLIQTPDLAMGWCRNSNWKSIQDGPAQWRAVLRIGSGDGCPVSPGYPDLEHEARSYIGVPYLLGGRTRKGIDCSGLIQQVFLSVTGVLFPRNSKDQRKCGKRIGLDHPIPGDLIFAWQHHRKIHHVAICVSDGVIHACRAKKMVICETLEAFKTGYRVIAVRRSFNFKDLSK